MERYKYFPVDASKNEIRLLTLSPSSAGPVSIRLRKAALTSPQKTDMSFEALSYVWGSADDAGSVLVENEDGAPPAAPYSTIAISRNLLTALPYLQRPHTPRDLWIDALCIDQEDLDERAQQVRLMARLYSSAERVVAWLGVPAEDSGFGLALLRRAGARMDVDWKSGHIAWGEPGAGERQADIEYDTWLLDCGAAFPAASREHRAVLDIYGRPYFERLWIRQEVHRSFGVIFVCGEEGVPVQDFRKATFVLHRKYMNAGDGRSQDLARRLAAVLEMFGETETRVERAITRTQAAKCFDPRDRVYAIFGLFPQRNFLNTRIVPDYTKRLAEVYREVIMAELEKEQRVTLLSHSEKRKTNFDRPSWVPDWSGKRTRSSLSGHFADGEAAATGSISEGGEVLRLEGLFVTTVKEVRRAKAGVSNSKEETVRGILRQFLDPINPTKSYKTGGTVRDACAYIFSGYRLLDCMSYMNQNEFLPSFAYMRDLLSSLISHREVDLRDKFGNYAIHISDVLEICEDHVLITTEDDLIGLANADSQPGDTVAIILGCGRPFILRPGPDDVYEVVGSSSIHGLNWGEAILGSVPTNTNIVWSDGGAWKDAYFRNTETGFESHYDPRIAWGELEVKTYTDDKIWYCDEIEEGDIRMYRYPNAEYLRRKGVPIRTVTLV